MNIVTQFMLLPLHAAITSQPTGYMVTDIGESEDEKPGLGAAHKSSGGMRLAFDMISSGANRHALSLQ